MGQSIKTIILAILCVAITLPLSAFSITSLIMSTGKYWECPGEPRVLSWLLGYGTVGIIAVWLCFVIVIERVIRHDQNFNLYFGIFYGGFALLLFLFGYIWSSLGMTWNRSTLVKAHYYYLDGKNYFCDETVYNFAYALSLMSFIFLNLTFCSFACFCKLICKK